jgi:hypothetical protein
LVSVALSDLKISKTLLLGILSFHLRLISIVSISHFILG